MSSPRRPCGALIGIAIPGVLLSAASRVDAADPAATVEASLGCGLIGGCLFTDGVVALDGAVHVVEHVRVGGKLWYWEAQRHRPEGTPPPPLASAFIGFGPFVEGYVRYRATEFSARLCGGGTRSIPDRGSTAVPAWGDFVEVSGAVHFYPGRVVLGPRVGIVAFGGQDDHFPTTPLFAFDVGYSFP